MSTKKNFLSKTVKRIKIKDILPEVKKLKLTIKKKVSKKKINSKKETKNKKSKNKNSKNKNSKNKKSKKVIEEFTVIKSQTPKEEFEKAKQIYDMEKNNKLKKLEQ